MELCNRSATDTRPHAEPKARFVSPGVLAWREPLPPTLQWNADSAKMLCKIASSVESVVEFLGFIRPFPHRRVVTVPARVDPRLGIFSGMGSCVQGLFCNDRFQAVLLVLPAGSTSSYLSSPLFKAHGTQEFMPQKIHLQSGSDFPCGVFVEKHRDLLNYKPVKDKVPTHRFFRGAAKSNSQARHLPVTGPKKGCE